MIKTKMTIPVRVLTVIGAIVLLISLFLPWATIHGELLDVSGTFSAMDLVKNTGSAILSYFFMGIYIILILTIVCVIYGLVGRPTTGMGVTLFITAGTYLVLLILLGSFFQSMMPSDFSIPGIDGASTADTDQDGLYDMFESTFGTDPERPDTDGDGLSDGAEVLEQPYSDPTKRDSDLDGIPDNQDNSPLGGLNEPGGGSNNSGADNNSSTGMDETEDMLEQINEINERMNMLTNTTVNAESGAYITTGASIYLIIMGVLLKVDKRKRKNLMIELKYHKKDLDSYRMCIGQALLDGFISEDELGMLDVQRNSMGISPDEHYAIVMEMASKRKADDKCIYKLLSIVDGSFRYKGRGIFRKRMREPRRESEERAYSEEKRREEEPRHQRDHHRNDEVIRGSNLDQDEDDWSDF